MACCTTHSAIRSNARCVLIVHLVEFCFGSLASTSVFLCARRDEAARLESRAAMLGAMMGTLQKDADAAAAARRSEHQHLVPRPRLGIQNLKPLTRLLPRPYPERLV